MTFSTTLSCFCHTSSPLDAGLFARQQSQFPSRQGIVWDIIFRLLLSHHFCWEGGPGRLANRRPVRRAASLFVCVFMNHRKIHSLISPFLFDSSIVDWEIFLGSHQILGTAILRVREPPSEVRRNIFSHLFSSVIPLATAGRHCNYPRNCLPARKNASGGAANCTGQSLD